MKNTTLSSEKQPTLKTYVMGFILSIIFTLVPYFVIVNHMFTSNILLTIILFFAMVQMLVQLLFFLHLGRETKPRWKLAVLISFVSLILMIVIASIWIMQHLNYSMSLLQLDNLMNYGEGF